MSLVNYHIQILGRDHGEITHANSTTMSQVMGVARRRIYGMASLGVPTGWYREC
jgi:hypothetical protein